MHELSIAAAIIDTATRHAAERPVTGVQLRVGHLRQVVPESLRFYFRHVAQGTACEGARLEIEVVPARLRCRGCGCTWDLQVTEFRCPYCGAGDVVVEHGDELQVESIEVEEAREACIA